MDSNAKQVFLEALRCLVGFGSIQSRLEAANSYLMRLKHPSDELPPNLVHQFHELMGKLRDYEKVDDTRGKALAHEILNLFAQLTGGVAHDDLEPRQSRVGRTSPWTTVEEIANHSPNK